MDEASEISRAVSAAAELDLMRCGAMYGRAVAFGVASTECSVEQERGYGVLRLLTLAALRLPDVAVFAELLHSYAEEDGAACWVAQALIGASSGALRLAHRAVELHACEVGYGVDVWLERALDAAAAELGASLVVESGSELYKRALAELARAQGVVLGNVGVFVDASVDPETLTHSKAALATALVRQGLVADAIRGGGDGLPLLRGVTAQTLAGVAAEEQVIVFGERVWCLRQLARTLRERHGVEARVADGSITTAEFEALKRRFTAGEFPVLCLSRIGHEGHNLQNASVLCHLDLPWLPSGLEQRVGRAARPGSARAHVQTYIPYIRRGGIEHVVSVLAARGAEQHQILDSFEGVHAAESTVATQLSEITGQVADSKDDAGYAATAARLRVAASVFGG